MPLFMTYFFLLSLANMGFPATSNYIGELFVLIGLYQSNLIVLFFGASGIILSAIYSIWLVNRIGFGTLKIKYIQQFLDISKIEFYILLVLMIFMLCLGVYCYPITIFINYFINSIAS